MSHSDVACRSGAASYGAKLKIIIVLRYLRNLPPTVGHRLGPQNIPQNIGRARPKTEGLVQGRTDRQPDTPALLSGFL